MQHAPAVTYPLGRSRWAFGLMLVLWLSGLVAAGLWTAHTGGPGWRQAMALSAAIGAGLWAGWNWCRTPAGSLAWDGKIWDWLPAEPGSREQPHGLSGGSIRACLDLQRVLLVSWHGGAGSREPRRWLWLLRSSCPERWDDLRRAVYSRAIPGALPPPRTAKT